MPSGYCDRTCELCTHVMDVPQQKRSNLSPRLAREGMFFGSESLDDVDTKLRRAAAATPTLEPTPGPSLSPRPTATPTRDVLEPTSGECNTVGACITTPNFPDRYPDYAECTWTTITSVIAQVKAFDLENGFDNLFVTNIDLGTQVFSGTEGPAGAVIGAGETITFKSDFGMSYSGFEICFVRVPSLRNLLENNEVLIVLKCNFKRYYLHDLI